MQQSWVGCGWYSKRSTCMLIAKIDSNNPVSTQLWLALPCGVKLSIMKFNMFNTCLAPCRFKVVEKHFRVIWYNRSSNWYSTLSPTCHFSNSNYIVPVHAQTVAFSIALFTMHIKVMVRVRLGVRLLLLAMYMHCWQFLCHCAPSYSI